jgi:UDPglucose 6-dehydrogenase
VALDTDESKVAMLEDGRMPFYEADLEEVVNTAIGAGRLFFTSDPSRAIGDAEVVFLCVGTPTRDSGEANLLAVERAAEMVAQHTTRDIVVVGKSTVPTGTAERIRRTLARHNGENEFHVVSNPEFLREGRAVYDSMYPIRILVGSDSNEALQTMRELFAPFVQEGAAWIETDVRTAELAKHACNGFLAMKVSFANALARVCELARADITDITEVMQADPRIGRGHLNAGLGYGGPCLPKDLAAFQRLVGKLGYDFPMLEEVARVNRSAVDAVFHKVEEVMWNLEGKRVAVLGLAFKAGTDDINGSPAMRLVEKLMEADADVVAFDPQANPKAKEAIDGLTLAPDAYGAAEGADCTVIATEWPEFAELDLARLKEVVKLPIVVDGRNIFDPKDMAAAGFTYLSVGRTPIGSR